MSEVSEDKYKELCGVQSMKNKGLNSDSVCCGVKGSHGNWNDEIV